MSMIPKLGSTAASANVFHAAAIPGAVQKAAGVAPKVAAKTKQGWLMRKLTSLPFIATLGLTGVLAATVGVVPGASELVATKVLPWLAGAGAGCWNKIAWAGKGIGSWAYSYVTSPFGQGCLFGSISTSIISHFMHAKELKKAVEVAKAATKL